SRINCPWGVVGDFNVIIDAEEKIEGRPYKIEESFDFVACLNDCDLQDGGETIVTHLARTCLDHTPLLIRCILKVTNHNKYFKFLNMWIEHTYYLEVVHDAWSDTEEGNLLHTLHQKIKKVSKSLSTWSRRDFVTIEDNVAHTIIPTLQGVKECVFSIDPDSAPRPDGLKIYQPAWEVIANDVHAIVVAFFQGFYINIQGPLINHLSFAEDTIIFSSGNKASLKLILKTSKSYENVSGQLINKNKSSYSLAPKAPQMTIRRIGRMLDMRFENLPMKYLGCPLYFGRKIVDIFSNMINKVINRIKGWQLKFLSIGGRATLIRHVLLDFNIHTLVVVHPPKGTIESIEKWKTPLDLIGEFLPYNEGGANFRNLKDICKALTTKQWWKFRTSNSMWTNILKSKYCTNVHRATVH
ncbi:hypothetical protein H5410_015329, partial [Solanum commersonii]